MVDINKDILFLSQKCKIYTSESNKDIQKDLLKFQNFHLKCVDGIR
jgi:hypothetical protein